MKKACYLLILLTMWVACAPPSAEQRRRVDDCNALSYHYRYLDIDSSAYYADAAYHMSEGYASGRAAAQNNLAFVAYQQMFYDRALDIIADLHSTCRNQVELLCADVMHMKIAQRVGEGKAFFDSRHAALRRIQRIREEEATLPPIVMRRFQYAHSELHLVSATYYYYLGQDSLAIAEMEETATLVGNTADTAQWLYFHYMLGSGGMITGAPDEVCLQEFDHLLRTYTVSTAHGHVYFRANALQSLATMLGTPSKRALLERERKNELAYLLSFSQTAPNDSASLDAVPLAERAYECFHSYNDIFQSACAKRTLGELYFNEGRYEDALHEFQQALDYVERQSGRSTRKLPQWMAGIREQLSLTYSALGNEQAAADNRNIYLQLLASTSQNYELQSRKEQLVTELHTARLWLYALLGLLALSLLLAVNVLVRMKRHAAGNDKQIQQIRETPQYRTYREHFDRCNEQLQDALDEATDNLQLSRLNCAKYRGGNVERRAKVAMVYAIIPYLDRILEGVGRMKKTRVVKHEILLYINQLSDEIMRINGVLTDWIQMNQGQVKLHVTSFPLQEVFDIVDGGRASFEKKGLTLTVASTAATVKADKALTLFMVNTLADNARKFTSTGGEVTISASETDAYVEVSVSDTGLGLSPADVATINDSKVYDAAALGHADSEKGFGFGIMNCKGIIGKYRKTSDLFRVCDFGLESREGSGSRFWFRLPRIATVLVMAFFLGLGNLKAQHEPVDTLQLMATYNELAMAAQSRHDWAEYRRCNDAYVRLHHLYTADATLPTFCARMQQLHTDNVVLYALLLLASMVLLGLFYLVLFRPRLSDRKVQQQLLKRLLQRIADAEEAVHGHVADAPSPDDELFEEKLRHYPAWQQIRDNLFAELTADEQCLTSLRGQIDELDEQLRKARFEEERLYVMNQILDNCLSTIKHETMYYPARTQQMVDYMQRSEQPETMLDELSDLVNYYKHVYMLLHEQAYRQLEQNNFHRIAIPLGEVQKMIEQDIVPSLRRANPSLRVQIASLPEASVVGDRDLLATLLRHLLSANVVAANNVVIQAEQQNDTICFTLSFQGSCLPETDVFSPTAGHIPYLIAKQIVREHDAYSGMPGLRLTAQNVPDGYQICFTLSINKAR